MKNYYFTFGSDERFPFQHGCVQVVASNRSEAVNIFNAKYPPRDKQGLVNCAFIYDEEEFKEAVEHLDRENTLWGSSRFAYVHCVIGRKE